MSTPESPALAGKVSGYFASPRPSLPGSWGVRKPIRVKLSLSPPEIKAEIYDENILLAPKAPNDPRPDYSSYLDHCSTPTPALAPRCSNHSDLKRSRIDIPCESEISALDIGPGLTQSHLKAAGLPRAIQAPQAARTGFMRSIPVAARSSYLEAMSAPENVKLRISDLDSETLTLGSSSTSPEPFPKRARQGDAMNSLPSDIRHPQPTQPHKFRHYDVKALEFEAVTFSSGISKNLETFHQERRRNVVRHLLGQSRRVWKKRVIRESDHPGLGYGSGFDVDLEFKDRHLHHAINLDPQTSDTSLSQPRPPQAIPPRNVNDPYPDIYTAATDDYNWSQEVYKRLEDDGKELDEQEARLDEAQPGGDKMADDHPIEDQMDEDQMDGELLTAWA